VPDLSVLIPARNEEFLQRTIDSVQSAIRADTEIIVVLDGYWPHQGIPQQDNLVIIHRPESIGQRAATNEAARVSTSPYIMKLDAHCSVGEGFDRILLDSVKELGRECVQVPKQFNHHAFDWMCQDCGERRYQGPTAPCKKCGGECEKVIVWQPRKSRQTTSWYFDRELKFGYWGAFSKTEEGRKEISETMSLLGACWFVERDWYWAQLEGMDEKHGGWGQMGTEIACKTWLSGGRLVCNKRTWFSHMFRTQGGDFGFPYSLTAGAQKRARTYSQDLWRNDKWPKAKRKFSWILDHFHPVKEWHDKEARPAKETSEKEAVPSGGENVPEPVRAGSAPALRTTSPSKGLVYYSDCRPPTDLLQACHRQLKKSASELPLVAVSLGELPFGRVVLNGDRYLAMEWQRGILTMFRQILLGLEFLDTDIAYLCEHDMLYHKSHFDLVPERDDAFYYNENTYKVDSKTGQALFYYTKQTSGLIANRKLLVEHYHRRIAKVVQNQREITAKGLPLRRDGFSRHMGFEPGCHTPPRGVDRYPALRLMSEQPNIDIRHGHNLTPSRWSQKQFRNPKSCLGWTMADEVPGWGKTRGRFDEFLLEVTR
jgi:glycosyltransferase involved in cell wall biosynthesis